MKNKLYSLRNRFLLALGLFALIAVGAKTVARAQNITEPSRRDQTLNGLKVLVWSDPKSPQVSVKLRIHAGSAFDPTGKPGAMRLLADSLFPELAQTREFFEEEFGGRLEISSNYDFIQIDASGNADRFEDILDTLRQAIINWQITPDILKKLRDARLATLQEESRKLEAIADNAARRRLLGDFPYGRPADGNPETLAKVETADLIQARERFLSADNATIAIVGNVQPSYAVRAVRQLFGPWRKADKLVPATFRQPDPADSKILIVDAPEADKAEIRIAVRGLARNDRDLITAGIWSGVVEKNLQKALPENRVSVEHFGNVLPGVLMIRASSPTDKAAQTLSALRAALTKAVTEKIDARQFEESRQTALNAVQTELPKLDSTADYWLNIDTYKMQPIAERLNLVKSATAADAEKVAAKLFKDAPMAVVIVGKAEEIQPQVDALDPKK